MKAIAQSDTKQPLSQKVRICVSERTLAQVDQLARDLEISRSDIFRQALRDYLSRTKRGYRYSMEVR